MNHKLESGYRVDYNHRAEAGDPDLYVIEENA